MERKELLGVVIDEIQHHFQLYKVERNAYLALAGVALLCLLAAVALLFLRPPGSRALAIAVLGGAGLVAFAAARSSAFFHGSIKLVEEVVKRYSKMSEPDLVSNIATLRKKSETSLLLMAAGAAAVLGSVAFAFMGAAAVERAVDRTQAEGARMDTEAATWKASFAGAQQAYATLKSSVTALYPAHVTVNHEVVEIRAVSQQPPGRPRSGAGGYAFALKLHASPAALASIKRVRYAVRYPNAEEQSYVAEDAALGFPASFAGPGCLSSVDVTLELQNGSTDQMVFDQCRSLGPQWAPVAAAPALRPVGY